MRAQNPERFLKENRLPYPERRGYSTFGYGRRICPVRRSFPCW